MVAIALGGGASTLAMAAELLGIRYPHDSTGQAVIETPTRGNEIDALTAFTPERATGVTGRAAPDGRPAVPTAASYIPTHRTRSPRMTRTLAELLPEGAAPPPLEPLFSPSKSRALLGLLGAQLRPEGGVDADRAVELMARGQPLPHIPRLWVQTTRGPIQLLLDIGRGMEPYRCDVDLLPEQFRKVVGSDGLDVRWFEDCPVGGPGVFSPGSLDSTPYRLPARGTLIVAVTAFGARGALPASTAVLQRWQQMLLWAARTTTPVIGLSPVPRTRLPKALPRWVPVVIWDRSARIQRTSNTLRMERARRSDGEIGYS